MYVRMYVCAKRIADKRTNKGKQGEMKDRKTIEKSEGVKGNESKEGEMKEKGEK